MAGWEVVVAYAAQFGVVECGLLGVFRRSVGREQQLGGGAPPIDGTFQRLSQGLGREAESQGELLEDF